MEYKPDWEAAKQRLEAFWNHAVIDRCCIAVHAPKDGAKIPPVPDLQNGPWMGGMERLADDDRMGIQNWWTDPEQNLQRALAWFENSYFAGEALPVTYVNWGAMSMAAMFGSPPEFNKTSVWYPAVIEDWETWQWAFDPAANSTWTAIRRIMECLVENAPGRFLVGSAELGNGADVLSLMRGMDRLAMDLIMYPEAVHRGIDFISNVWVELMEQMHRMTVNANQGGSVLAWMGMWAPGRTDQIACDFASVISPTHFKTFCLPEVIKMGNWCENGIFHLDGPRCMKTILDILLTLPQIKTIQFTPGAGSPPTYTEAYIPRYRQILESGRGLYLLVQPHEVEKILAELPPEGLFMRTYVGSQAEADEMIKNVTRWSAPKHVFGGAR